MSSLSKSFRLSSILKIGEEAMMISKNQGIGSILGSDERTAKSSSSLRRTLSADMSSAQWLAQHGLISPMKKIASSGEFSLCSVPDSSSASSSSWSFEDEEEQEPRSQFDVWSSIQEDEKKKRELDDDEQNKPGQFDIWSSIIQQKSEDFTENKAQPPSPYVHPLVKRSSSLTEKSLEICTESLGSETGSDGFSSYPTSESGEATDKDKEIMEPEQQVVEQLQSFTFDQPVLSIPKYNYVIGKKSPSQRSFPPPIPSRRDGASSIRMQSRRDNGRLVLEAVSVPSTNNFLAQRQDGRLVLTFVKTTDEVPKIDEQVEEEEAEETKEEFEEMAEDFDSFDDEGMESDEAEEEEEEEEEEETAFVMEQAPKLLSSRMMNVHKLTLMGLANRDPTWPNKFNQVVEFHDVDQEDIIKPTIVAKSLPPMPRMIRKPPRETPAVASAAATAAAGVGGATFNEYEYYWRPKPMMTPQSKRTGDVDCDDNKLIPMAGNQRLLVLRGNKGDYLVPLVKCCKEPRRSLLFWEPHCIATS